MSRSVLCIVPGPSRAKRIADDMRAAGYLRGDISVVIPDRFGAREFAFDSVADVNALALPGMGPFLATGPLVGLLREAAQQGAGGVRQVLERLGLTALDAKQLEAKLKAGSSLVAVHVDDKLGVAGAQEICARHRAEQVYIGEGSSAEPAQ